VYGGVLPGLDRTDGKFAWPHRSRLSPPTSMASEVAGRGSAAKGRLHPQAGQMAGNAGQVIELTDPAGSDEWIVVRFGRDELPFSPADLAVTGRPAPPRNPAALASVPAPRTVAAREEIPVPARRTPAPTPPAPPPPAPVAAKAPKQPRPPKAPAPLVVTLTYTDQRWTVAAHHGSKALAKPYVITPTEALRMVALIEVPGVHDAVASIIAAERVEAENRAQRLRAELAAIESRLAELAARS
jgi:hypothetical protein